MDEIERYDAIVRKHTDRIDLYYHLAQELAELTAALLKYSQVITGRDPAGITEVEALDRLYDETIDVMNYFRVLKLKDVDRENPFATAKKMKRWVERLGANG